MSSIHLCPLNSVFESFYDFFFIWSLTYFPLEYMKTTRSRFCIYSRVENVKLQNKKKSGKIPFQSYFGKRHDMIQCTTFKNIFLKNTFNLRHYIVDVTFFSDLVCNKTSKARNSSPTHEFLAFNIIIAN